MFGLNPAVPEAMAAGLPVIGNRHPSSPIRHGHDGFLADEPAELRGYAERLLADPDLARRMGTAARGSVRERFHLSRFVAGLRAAIEQAQQNWNALSAKGPAAA